MPRGVAIPNVDEQLFDAAGRVLRRDGPEGLNSRAVTTEAGTAKGLLYAHFEDFDTFLAAFVMNRGDRLLGSMSRLPDLAGTGDVAQNLADTALAVAPEAAALMNLVHARWSVAANLRRPAQGHGARLLELEQTFADYLEAERRLGRVAADADTTAVATALVGTLHQLAISSLNAPELEDQVRRVVNVIVRGILPG
jgi:AcrR family transcriptional regulator